ncbi:MAG TPA: hypothetical protein VGB14_18025 [Acidimicrobiales bacterium]|jgi:hypothetical protein
MRRSTAVSVAVALAVTGAAAAWRLPGREARLEGDGPRATTDGFVDAGAWLDGVDAVVEAEAVAPVERFSTTSTAHHLLLTLDGAAPRYQATSPAGGGDPPGPIPGERLTVREPTGASEATSVFAGVVPGTPVLVTLAWFADRPDYRTPWGVVVAFTVDPDGAVHALGPSGATIDEQLGRIADGGATVDTVVDWVGEADARRADPSAPAPLHAAYGSAASAPEARAAGDDWYQLPATVRPLDPELTPPEVLDGLDLRAVLIDVADPGRFDGELLVIRTPLGVADVSELAAGTHPTSVLVPPTGRWDVVVTDEDGGAETPIGTVPPTVWRSLDATVVSVTPGPVPGLRVSPVTSAAYDRLLAGLAGPR